MNRWICCSFRACSGLRGPTTGRGRRQTNSRRCIPRRTVSGLTRMRSCSHNSKANRPHDQRLRKKPKSCGVDFNSHRTTKISHEGTVSGCSSVRKAIPSRPVANSRFTERIKVGLAKVAAGSRGRNVLRPATTGPVLAEPSALSARSSNTFCVPASKDEDGHPWLGLRGLWSSITHNLRAKPVFYSRSFSLRATHGARSYLDREDPEVASAMLELMKDEGIEVLLQALVLNVTGRSGSGVTMQVRSGGKETSLEGSDILVAAGRTPNTDRINAAHSRRRS